MPSQEHNPASAFYFAARRFVCQKRMSQDIIDDFPSYALIFHLQGRKSNISHIFVDYIREKLGREGKKLSMEQAVSKDLDTLFLTPDVVEMIDIKQRIEAEPHLVKYRCLLAQGFTQEDIGRMEGVSGSAISQRLSSSTDPKGKSMRKVTNEHRQNVVNSIMSAIETGLPLTQACALAAVTPATYYQYRAMLGMPTAALRKRKIGNPIDPAMLPEAPTVRPYPRSSPKNALAPGSFKIVLEGDVQALEGLFDRFLDRLSTRFNLPKCQPSDTP